MQLSTLIGKPVLSPSGENYGYVTNARLSRDYKSLACLECADREEEEFYIPMRSVLAVDDAVIAGAARLSALTGVPSPIGAQAFSCTGEALGTVCDLLLGDGSEAVLVVVKDGIRTTAPVECASVGERVVVYPDRAARERAAGRAARAHKAPVPRPKKAAAPRTEKTEPAQPDIRPVPPPPQPEVRPKPPEPELPVPPERPANTAISLLNRTDLLGRRVRKSVFDERGIPVALAGERITPAVLSRARRCNRLLALAASTITTSV